VLISLPASPVAQAFHILAARISDSLLDLSAPADLQERVLDEDDEQ